MKLLLFVCCCQRNFDNNRIQKSSSPVQRNRRRTRKYRQRGRERESNRSMINGMVNIYQIMQMLNLSITHTHTYTILSRILLELSLHPRYFTHISWQTTWKSPSHTENVLNPPIPDILHFDTFIRAIAVVLSHCFHLAVWSALLP